MDRMYFLLLITSFLQGYFLESINSSYGNNYTSITEQITTPTPNISSTQFPKAQWWDFDELRLGKPKINETWMKRFGFIMCKNDRDLKTSNELT